MKWGTFKGRKRQEGTSLFEIVISLAISTVGLAALVDSYVLCTRQAESSAFIYAAQSQALERLEETRAAKWDRKASPLVDDVQSTNFPMIVRILDVPKGTRKIYGTNYTTIQTVSTTPPLKLIEVACVWPWVNGKVYTNIVTTYRAPDQ